MQPRRCPHRPTLLKLFQIRWLSRLSVAVSLSLWTMALDETLSKCVCVCVCPGTKPARTLLEPRWPWSWKGDIFSIGLSRVCFLLVVVALLGPYSAHKLLLTIQGSPGELVVCGSMGDGGAGSFIGDKGSSEKGTLTLDLRNKGKLARRGSSRQGAYDGT